MGGEDAARALVGEKSGVCLSVCGDGNEDGTGTT